MNVIPIFPTPIFIQNLEITKEIQDELYSLKTNRVEELLPSGEKVCDIWGENTENKQVLRLEKLSSIRNNILINAKKFATEVMGFEVEGLVDVLSWVNNKTNSQEHKTHVHPNSFISGVLYFDDEYDENSALIFEKNAGTSAMFQMIPKKNHKIQNDFSIYHFAVPASKGRLIIFPSHLPHFVPKNDTNKSRYSLAFNLMPVGGYGDITNLTEFKYMTALQY
jgi:uncharacterized protein (TIGR02466 family)